MIEVDSLINEVNSVIQNLKNDLKLKKFNIPQTNFGFFCTNKEAMQNRSNVASRFYLELDEISSEGFNRNEDQDFIFIYRQIKRFINAFQVFKNTYESTEKAIMIRDDLNDIIKKYEGVIVELNEKLNYAVGEVKNILTSQLEHSLCLEEIEQETKKSMNGTKEECSDNRLKNREAAGQLLLIKERVSKRLNKNLQEISPNSLELSNQFDIIKNMNKEIAKEKLQSLDELLDAPSKSQTKEEEQKIKQLRAQARELSAKLGIIEKVYLLDTLTLIKNKLNQERKDMVIGMMTVHQYEDYQRHFSEYYQSQIEHLPYFTNLKSYLENLSLESELDDFSDTVESMKEDLKRLKNELAEKDLSSSKTSLERKLSFKVEREQAWLDLLENEVIGSIESILNAEVTSTNTETVTTTTSTESDVVSKMSPLKISQ